MKKIYYLVLLLLSCSLVLCSHLYAKPAIIIASFGTTVPEAVRSIENITKRVKKACPDAMVKVVFTSNIIRGVWKKRSRDPQKWRNQGISDEILFTKNLLCTFGELKSAGIKEVVVQPTHLFHMEQYHDLTQYVDAIRSIQTIRDKWKPFNKIALGRPAMGTVGDKFPYKTDLKRVVAALKNDIVLAQKENAALVYMGHGNELWSTGIYAELQQEMRKTYPDVKTFVGCVEGSPSFTDVQKQIAHYNAPKIKNILLKPLMIVAGDHASNDMAGHEEDSWKSGFEHSGYKVHTVLKGLGSNNQFADIFVSNIKDAAKAADINL